jgi:hypothetical protein
MLPLFSLFDPQKSAKQQIARDTKFYQETIAPLISDEIETDQKPLLIRIPKPLSGDPNQIIKDYLDGITEIANQAGHQHLLSNRRVIFLINQGDAHWTVFSTDDTGNLNPQHGVTSDGTCGLSSALVVCKEISKEDDSQAKYNHLITESISATNIPTNTFTFNNPANLEPLIPEDTRGKVSNLVATPSNTDFWLIDADITKIINHNEPDKFRSFNALSLLNKTDRANQINFATAYSNANQSSYAGNFAELLPNSTNYRSVQYFYEELDQEKLKSFLTHHSQRTDLDNSKKINLYKICEQYSFFQEDSTNKIKFTLGDCSEKSAIDTEISKMKSKFEADNKTSQALISQSPEALDVSGFFQNRFDQNKCISFLTTSKLYFNSTCTLSFKEKLFNSAQSIDHFYFKNLNQESLPSLPQNILEIIVPKSCHPDTRNYKGWGKVIESKIVDGKTTLEFEGKKIESIEIAGEDKLKEILELKNHFLINCAILDLLRNSNQDISVKVQVKVQDKILERPFLQTERKTIIDNQIVDNPTAEQINSLTETRLDVAKRIYDQKISDKITFPRASSDDFENIKKHIEERFRLLEKQLKDSNAIIVIPGSYDDKGNFKHALGTLRAVGQWGNKIYSDEIKDIIEQKIAELRVSNPGKVFFGNIGTEVVVDGDRTFYPQFPVGDQTWDDFENKFRANIEKISPGEKQALIKNYETNLGRSFSRPDDKLDDILKHLKTNFTNKNFIHVWGANNDNWNNDLGQWGGGGGQATAFKANQNGVFALVTTPVTGTKNLMDKCKIYGAPPSAKPSHPQALTVVEAGAGAGVTIGGPGA